MNTANVAFTGSIPDNYERYLGPWLFEPYAADLAAYTKGRQVSAVLELACGTGRLTMHLARMLHQGVKLTATDLNPDMIAAAKQKMPTEDIVWKVADMQQLPFADSHFDLVVCQFGVMFVPDKRAAFSEVFRVLKKGGIFLFNTWNKLEQNGASALTEEVMNRHFQNDPIPFFKIPFSMHDKTEMQTLLNDAGFSNTKITLSKKEGRTESALEAAKGLLEGTPVYSYLAARAPSRIPAIISDVEKEMISRYGDHPMISPLEAWVAEATK